MKNTIHLLYNSTPPYLYGYLQVVDRKGKHRSSSPFIISEKIDDATTVVYGSVQNLLEKLGQLSETLRTCNISMAEELEKNEVPIKKQYNDLGREILQLPLSGISGQIFQKYTMEVENVILLMGLYSRILFEIIPKAGESKIPIYNYSNKRVGRITLNDIADLFLHHRYLFIDGEHIKDLFTERKYLSTAFMGGKVRWQEYANAIKETIHLVKIRDLTKILSSSIYKMSGASSHGEIVSLVQNMQSLTNIMSHEILDTRYSNMLNLLFDKKANEFLDLRGKRKSTNVQVLFKNPHFQIKSELSQKQIDVTVSMEIRIGNSSQRPPNLETHHVYIGYVEFFRKIDDLFGDDPLLPDPA